MSAKESLSSRTLHLNRIKIFSRILKVLLLFYLLYSMSYLPFVHRTVDGLYYQVVWGVYEKISQAPIIALIIVLLGVGLFLTAVISGYQLLTLYEKGIVFSARNVQLLRRIGYLACGYGLLAVWGPVLVSSWHSYIFGGWVISYRWFMPLLRSPCLIGGLFVVVVSHIMDEGRKIQEEQELTV